MSNDVLNWESIRKTDPAYTKRANKGGNSPEFTAIDAYYNIYRATELFGPLGQSWGWGILHHEKTATSSFVLIELWYHNPEGRRCTIQVFGETAMHGKPSVDEDALKKALTDAITKGLSYLGFSADVYLGRFDDNKYVNQRIVESNAERLNQQKEYAIRVANALSNATTLDELEQLKIRYRSGVIELPVEHKAMLHKTATEKEEELRHTATTYLPTRHEEMSE